MCLFIYLFVCPLDWEPEPRALETSGLLLKNKNKLFKKTLFFTQLAQRPIQSSTCDVHLSPSALLLIAPKRFEFETSGQRAYRLY